MQGRYQGLQKQPGIGVRTQLSAGNATGCDSKT
jgi:hypothetical protein